jgi:hypothetical protein
MRLADADPWQVAAPVSRARRPFKARLVAVALGAAVLAGCESLMPIPDMSLLTPQPAPKCEPRSAVAAGEAGEAAKLRNLDYERQCYRHAEIIARNRLGKLQNSIKESAKAAKAAAKREADADPE